MRLGQFITKKLLRVLHGANTTELNL